MIVRMLPSAPDSPQRQLLTTFLVNDAVAIDAGCLGLYGEPRDQGRIGHVFLSHSHADHVCSLPMFVTNVYDQTEDTIVVHGHPDALESLRTDVFNGRVWPNFLAFSRGRGPFLELQPLEPRQAVTVNGLRITPVPVNHVVPTFGYLVDEGAAAVVFSSDSGPTDDIWQAARAVPHLKAAFVGVAYPDRLHELAVVAGHLTPRLFRNEVAKLPPHVAVQVIHIKASYRTQVVAELTALGLANVSIGECGRAYVF